MNSGKLRVSYGKMVTAHWKILTKHLPICIRGGKMQGYIVSSGDLYLMRYLMAQRMKNPNLQWERHNRGTLHWTLDFERPYHRYIGILSDEYQRYDYETTSV